MTAPLPAASYAIAEEVKAFDRAAASMREAAGRLVQRAIERGASLYIRERDLPKLLHRSKWEGKLDGEIRDMLTRAIAGGSKAVAAGAWHADGNRLMALRQALKGENSA